MIQILLRLLLPFRSVISRSGIDFNQLTEIIRIKLTVDNRMSKKPGKEKDTNVNNALIRQGLSMMLVNSLFFILLISQQPLSFVLITFHCILLLFSIISYLSEYNQLLFDTRDSHILLRLPVSSQTITIAKLITIAYYLVFLTLCSSIIPFLIISFKYGFLAGISLLIASFLNSLFALFLTNLLYLGGMRFLSAEKFNKVTSYVQIVIVVLAMVGYQLIVNLKIDYSFELSTGISWWLYITPPVFFSAMTEYMLHPAVQTGLIALTGLALVIILFFLTARWLAPYFTTGMEARTNEESNTGKKIKKERIAQLLSSFLTHNSLQKASFLVTWRLASGNTKFKESILPSMAYVFVMIAIVVFKNSGEDTSSFILLSPLYFVLLLSMTISDSSKYNRIGNQFWIYQSKPVSHPGAILLGTFKAICIKYITPVFVIASAIILYITGIGKLDSVLFIFSLIVLYTLFFNVLKAPAFPFSQEKTTTESGATAVRVFILLGICLIFGFLHYLLTSIPLGVIAGTLIIWILIIFTVKAINNISWETLEKNNRN